MKAVIIAGGTPPSERVFREELKNADILLAADRGTECYLNYNMEPHYALGDFDSISEVAKKQINNTIMQKFNPEKDNTDSEIALLKAIELGATKIVLLGVTGTRIDHLLANIGLLDICLDEGIYAYIRDNNNKIFLTDKSEKLYGELGQIISFQSFGECVKNFSIKGAKYELKDYNLSFGDGRCVSNEFLSTPIEISFKKGKVLIIYCND